MRKVQPSLDLLLDPALQTHRQTHMTNPLDCQLLLLGVKESFSKDFLNPSHSKRKASSVSLFDQCVLTDQAMKALCPAQHARFTIEGVPSPQAFKTPSTGLNSLALLLVNTTQSLEQERALEWRKYLAQERAFAYEVIYGHGLEMLNRIRFAWSAALQTWQFQVSPDLLRPLASPRYSAYCDKCSDPLCEGRLFGLPLFG
jgi:hypothetical protein